MDLHTAGHRRGVVCAPHSAAVEAGRADARRGRQRARGDGRDGGLDRGRLSAHERHRRRRLLARARAVGPRARADGGGPRRRARAAGALSRATTTIPPRGPLAALTVPGAIGGWMLALEAAKAQGGALPLDVLLGHAIRQAARGHAGRAQPRRPHRRRRRRAEDRAGLRADLPGRRQAAGRRARCCGSRRSPRRSSSSPMPGSPISIAATSAREIAADLERVGAPVTRADLERATRDDRRAAVGRRSTPARSTTRRRRRRASPR